VDGLFDAAAPHYDWICRVMSLGSGQLYRRQALLRAGLRPGQRVLDVATGTGLVARAALEVVGQTSSVVGVDPSAGMLEESRRGLPVSLIRGRGEALPVRDREFDLVSMGYALRHVPELAATFREYHRVLKPGGRVVLLEISRPRSAAALALARFYLKKVVPLVTRLGTGSRPAAHLMEYYWDTIEHCVPPEAILDALRAAGFADVERRVTGAILSEYAGRKSTN
jgi:demethylmenaquinone methyltransferase/2-methoxy-6-polyprenyl-1,4-benzoquinol methylase